MHLYILFSIVIPVLLTNFWGKSGKESYHRKHTEERI